ncbi:MAG TPA: hypothetical protein VLK27_12050 [Chthoniobacterales bacterium]|nr:hypothetical protein [Chthoniobacterales bacterium]
MRRIFLLFALCGLTTWSVGGQKLDPLNAIGEKYARLVLALGQHDPDYVDAFYGPGEWKAQAEKEKKSLDAIATEATQLSDRLQVMRLQQSGMADLPSHEATAREGERASPYSIDSGTLTPPGGGAGPTSQSDAATTKKSDAMDCCAPETKDGDLVHLRREYLEKQLYALIFRAKTLLNAGIKGPKNFDAESRALYDAVAPTYHDSFFDDILKRLDTKIPGTGPLWQRYEEWRKPFVIPKEKLDAVFQLAIKECRARTLAHVALPPNESFTVEYVTNKPWGGYNWYKGNFHSVIQVNTDLPIYIDRAVDLAAHEGYPAHHVYNSLLEKNLVRDRGWMEFSVYALFSPQSLIAEGTANFGREIAFPNKAERMKFEKEVLFPAAGIDATRADEYYAVQDLMKDLNYAVNEAARRLINGEIDEKAAAEWLQKYAVMEPPRAEKRVKFIERYRSYVINYNLGEDMVKKYIEKRAGNDPEKKWSEFGKLLASPRLPSGLTQ